MTRRQLKRCCHTTAATHHTTAAANHTTPLQLQTTPLAATGSLIVKGALLSVGCVQVAKELFEIKQQPPPIAPPPEAIPPPGYIPHKTKLAYMEAKLHRSYASFLSGTHSAVLQLEKLYRVPIPCLACC